MNKRINLSVPKLSQGVGKEEIEKAAEKFVYDKGRANVEKRITKGTNKTKTTIELHDVPEKYFFVFKKIDCIALVKTTRQKRSSHDQMSSFT